MNLDAQNTYCTDQVVTVTAASTDLIDHLEAGMGGEKQRPAKILCQVTADFATCDSVTAALQTDTVENFASPTTLQSQLIAVADLVAGAKFNLGMLPSNLQQYSRLYFTVAGSAATGGGSITAGLVPAIQEA